MGSSWKLVNIDKSWDSVSISFDGNTLCAITEGKQQGANNRWSHSVYVSDDYGVNWSSYNIVMPGKLVNVSVSFDGTEITFIDNNQFIWHSTRVSSGSWGGILENGVSFINAGNPDKFSDSLYTNINNIPDNLNWVLSDNNPKDIITNYNRTEIFVPVKKGGQLINLTVKRYNRFRHIYTFNGGSKKYNVTETESYYYPLSSNINSVTQTTRESLPFTVKINRVFLRKTILDSSTSDVQYQFPSIKITNNNDTLPILNLSLIHI